MEKPDVLDKSVAFLQKRDGIDKVLKITRYTSKLLLATVLTDSKTELAASLKNFEASVGTSRKAFRLGKFLQDVQTLRKTQYTTLDGALELVGSGGEGLYYFLEQFVWLVKAGAIHKRHGRSLQKLSAWPEFVGYFGSVTLKCLQVVSLLEKEGAVIAELQARNPRQPAVACCNSKGAVENSASADESSVGAEAAGPEEGELVEVNKGVADKRGSAGAEVAGRQAGEVLAVNGTAEERANMGSEVAKAEAEAEAEAEAPRLGETVALIKGGVICRAKEGSDGVGDEAEAAGIRGMEALVRGVADGRAATGPGQAVSAKAHAQKGASWAEKNAVLVGELAALRAKRFVKTLAVVQDLSDSLLALNDIWDGKGPLASPALLSLAGLVSALISAHKNWVAV